MENDRMPGPEELERMLEKAKKTLRRPWTK